MSNNKNHQDEAEQEQQQIQAWREKKKKRRGRTQQQQDDDGDVDPFSSLLNNDDDYQQEDEDEDDVHLIIMTAAKRRKQEQEELLMTDSTTVARGRKQALLLQQRDHRNATKTVDPHDDPEENTNQDEDGQKDNSKEPSNNEEQQQQQQPSLLEQAEALLQDKAKKKTAEQYEEERILREASKVQTNALQAATEIAHGIAYDKPMPSTWTVPQYILEQPESEWEHIRKEWHMEISGDDVPPPIKRFVDLKLPQPLLNCLESKMKIMKPTPIQIQGLPVALSGRDLIGIAFTGSGKSLTFTIPLVTQALEEEMRFPLLPQEGPIGIILAPSRELARQTYELVQTLCQSLTDTNNTNDKGNNYEHYKYPEIRCQLLIGGESVRDQLQLVNTSGIHCVVATPGRLRDVLKRKSINLHNCRYICLDEADRMLDMGFDEEVGEIMNYFPRQRQTLLFSATFPKKFQDFARHTLVRPIVVNVGRAGAANLDVIQEVEYVKDDAKIVYLLHCLQKTAPPVIIFCERKGDADNVHEYLMLKGVEAVSIHGGKDQEERNEAIRLFKGGEKDVLIATDIAAKGLDFPAIQHVINFDMPSEIENYVHRIGRTGRAGKTGVATTFINKSCEETTLLDLKALLREARQRIPPVLMMLDDPIRDGGSNGVTNPCAFCGGPGHTIQNCPKIDKDARRVAGNQRDVLTGGGDW